MTYAVFSPTKTSNGTKVLPTFVTDDKDAAIRYAQDTRAKLQAKGWDSWAAKVAIKAPTTAKGYWDLAQQVAEYGHMLDDATNGNSFLGQQMINWANILKVRADEEWNPEAYAA